ncbi:sigma-70 family RNA polymerase sigma factor [Neobacillus mesonae]|nr:sigma-70 family RNA polymerase sigma factor [Neobacillus mesonae]
MDITKEVKKAQKGNHKSFEYLINAHKVTMYQVARTLLANDADCADAIQEAILKAFSKINNLREPIYFKTWLLRILMNECNQIHRQNKKVIDFNELTQPSASESGFDRVELEQLLAILPEEDSKLLKLYHIEDISIKDLAEIYEKSDNTIKTWLRRARENARTIWGEQEEFKWKNGSKT